MTSVFKGLEMLRGALESRFMFQIDPSFKEVPAYSSITEIRESNYEECMAKYEKYDREVKEIRAIFNDPQHRPSFQAAVDDAVRFASDAFLALRILIIETGQKDGEEIRRVAQECADHQRLYYDYTMIHNLWTTLILHPMPDRVMRIFSIADGDRQTMKKLAEEERMWGVD